jgi:ABC-type antimicrobial peptide transport system permease subunit
VGLYGLLFYLVSQRSRDIGVRLALGAQRRSIFYLVAGHGLRLTIVGTAIGIVAVLLVMRLLNTALYGIAPNDPVTIGLVSALLIGLALLASSLPAYRATKVDPVFSLRQQ